MSQPTSTTLQAHDLGVNNFSFTAVDIDELGASEYTLVTIAIDVTGSVGGFAKELRAMLVASVESCKGSPRSDNLLVRVITFSTALHGGIQEIHGFTQLFDIDVGAYPALVPGGGTPLYDATFSAVAASNNFARDLVANNYGVNGICFIITDGDDNSSSVTPAMIKGEVDTATKGEVLKSMVTVLIGINASTFKAELETFQKNAGLTHYIDMGDVTEAKLAKLAGYISQSISSQSQALGTGGSSRQISTTI
jgi:uncharacterized protein YegL